MNPCRPKAAAVITLLYLLAVCICLVGSYYDISLCEIGLLLLIVPGGVLLATFSERAISLGVQTIFFWLVFTLSVSFNVFVFNWLCWLYRKNNPATTSVNK